MKFPVLSTTFLVVSTSIALAQAPATNPPAAPGTAPAAPTTATTPATGAPAQDKPKQLSLADKSWLKRTVENLYFAIQLTDRTKQQKAVQESTKSALKKINGDLNKIWADLATLYTDAGEKLPGALSGGDKSKDERIKKSGKNFDKEVLDVTSKEVRGLAHSFESGTKLENPKLKELSAKWQPVMKGYDDELDAAEKAAMKAK